MRALQPFDVWTRDTWGNQEVAGEHYYAKSWRAFFPKKIPIQGIELAEQALLIRDPKNRHDRNAVRVEIRGQHVGHLPAEDAIRYRSILDHLASSGWAARVPARLWVAPEIEYEYDRSGGTREVDTGKLVCRITLSLPEPHLLIPLNPPPPVPHAMLPMGGSVMVKTDGIPMVVFEPVLTDAGEGWVHATMHELREQLPRSVRETIEVRINGQQAGQLTPAMSKKFLPIVRTLAEQGRVCATPAIVRGNRLQVEVRVFGTPASALPQEWLLEHANHAVVARPGSAVPVNHSGPTRRSANPGPRTPTISTTSPDIGQAPSSPIVGEAGWFPDPQGVAPLRFWDGTTWTSRIRMR